MAVNKTAETAPEAPIEVYHAALRYIRINQSSHLHPSNQCAVHNTCNTVHRPTHGIYVDCN